MRRTLALFLVLAINTPLHAQTVPPALMVKVDDKSQPLGLAKLETEVRILGYVAETAATMTFFNPLDRVMEGDLYFPLPEGATVSGYALDVEGKMVDGVAVEKRKGREVFEEIVRQGIDPGLVEWTKGNNFKTRVFPIPPRGTRTIRVEYVTDLLGSPGHPAYHLPLNFKRKLREFSLRVEVVKPGAEPKIEKGRLANFAFERWRDGFVAETKLTNVTLTEDLIVALPNVQEQNVLVEKAGDGDVYFAIRDFPEVPSGEQAAPPKHMVLYWDASGSRTSSDHEREIGLVKAYVESLARPASARKRMVHVDVILLRNEQSKQKHFVFPATQPDRLIAELKRVEYDGGTQIGALTPKPGLPTPDFYMLFTDGISNFGTDLPAGMDAPVYVFSADATADHAFLRHLAMTTGGRYFNLKRMDDASVVPAIGQPAYCLLSAEAGEGQVAQMVPELPQPIAGRFTLVGKLAGNEAKVTVNYGYPGGESAEKRTFTVSRDEAAEGSLLRRLWAQTKLADLMDQQERNEAEIVALGKEQGMVTPFTSLIVLDSLDQYLEHEIAPPKSLPEMQEEYLRQVDTIEFQERKQKADKLEAVVEMWKARVEWWNTKFKYPKDFKYKEPKNLGAGMGGGGGGFFGGRAPRAADPEMPENPMPAPAEEEMQRRPELRASAAEPSAPQTIEETESEMVPFESNLSLIVGGGEEATQSRRQPGIVIKP
ncbi:MAG: VIT domain-containing protein, partial [Planctomycetota bacterium]